jgi:hypothetical protein
MRSKVLGVLIAVVVLVVAPAAGLAASGVATEPASFSGVTSYQWAYWNSQSCDGRTVYQLYRTEFRWYRSSTAKSVQAKTTYGHDGINCSRQYKNGSGGWSSWTTPCWHCGNSSSNNWTKTYAYSTTTWPYVSSFGGSWSGSWAHTRVYQGGALQDEFCRPNPVFGNGVCAPI